MLFIACSLRGAEYQLLSSFLIFGAFFIENSQARILLGAFTVDLRQQ